MKINLNNSHKLKTIQTQLNNNMKTKISKISNIMRCNNNKLIFNQIMSLDNNLEYYLSKSHKLLRMK